MPMLSRFEAIRFPAVQDVSLSRQFELEAQRRAIDACSDVEELRKLAKSLLNAWHMQSEMTKHYGAQALRMPPAPAGRLPTEG